MKPVAQRLQRCVDPFFPDGSFSVIMKHQHLLWKIVPGTVDSLCVHELANSFFLKQSFSSLCVSFVFSFNGVAAVENLFSILVPHSDLAVLHQTIFMTQLQPHLRLQSLTPLWLNRNPVDQRQRQFGDYCLV